MEYETPVQGPPTEVMETAAEGSMVEPDAAVGEQIEAEQDEGLIAPTTQPPEEAEVLEVEVGEEISEPEFFPPEETAAVAVEGLLEEPDVSPPSAVAAGEERIEAASEMVGPDKSPDEG